MDRSSQDFTCVGMCHLAGGSQSEAGVDGVPISGFVCPLPLGHKMSDLQRPFSLFAKLGNYLAEPFPAAICVGKALRSGSYDNNRLEAHL